MFDNVWFVDEAYFISQGLTGCQLSISRENVFLMKRLGPHFWNPILDFVPDCFFIWASCQSLGQRLLMKLIKFVVKLSDHLLDASALFFMVDLLVNRLLDIRNLIKS